MPMPDLKTILTGELPLIIQQYDPVAMGELLSKDLVELHVAIKPYLLGIGVTIYPEFKPRRSRSLLSPANRERCAVALLASRSRRFELALHLYMALANGVEPEELAQILVATGVYTGVDTIGAAFGVFLRTLATLKGLAGARTVDPATVFAKLRADFP